MPAKSTPMYIRIAEAIREDIVSKYPKNSRLPPQRDLAQRFGASYVTIGKALARLVEEGMITRRVGVGTIVNDLDSRSRGIVGVLSSTADPEYVSHLFGEIENRLRAARYRPVLFGGTADLEDEKQAFREMGKLNEAGLILYSFFGSQFQEQVDKLRQQGVACVSVLRPIKGLDLVTTSHRRIGRLQASYLHDTNFRHALYIGRAHERYGRIQREWFLRTLTRLKTLTNRSLAITDVFGETGHAGEAALHEQMAAIVEQQCREHPPDAIVTCGDRYLITVGRTLKKLGFLPGRDVTLISTDNKNLTEFPYVTIDLRLRACGRAAVAMLLDRIDGRYDGPARLRTVRPRLVVHRNAIETHQP